MKAEGGFFLIEALIALLIFTLGILGMIGMGATAVGAQSDARYRSDAATLADEIAGHIQLNADRSNLANLQLSLNSFQHQPGGANCAFNGAPSGDAGFAGDPEQGGHASARPARPAGNERGDPANPDRHHACGLQPRPDHDLLAGAERRACRAITCS